MESSNTENYNDNYYILSKEHPGAYKIYLNLRWALTGEGCFQESGTYKIILEIVMKSTEYYITSYLNMYKACIKCV